MKETEITKNTKKIQQNFILIKVKHMASIEDIVFLLRLLYE